MAVYCIVQNGVVTNTIEWDGITPYADPFGGTLIEASGEGQIGATWDGTTFVMPVPEAPQQPPIGSGPGVL